MLRTHYAQPRRGLAEIKAPLAQAAQSRPAPARGRLDAGASERAERDGRARRSEQRRGQRQLGTEGERPASPFGGLPISELAILAGGSGWWSGFIQTAARR